MVKRGQGRLRAVNERLKRDTGGMEEKCRAVDRLNRQLAARLNQAKREGERQREREREGEREIEGGREGERESKNPNQAKRPPFYPTAVGKM